MIEEILNNLFGLFITILAGIFAWQSTLLVEEKRQRERDERDSDLW